MPECAGFLLKDFSLKWRNLKPAILFGFAYSEPRHSRNIYENALFFSQKCPVKCLGTIFYGGNTHSSGLQSLFPYRGRSFYLGRCEKEYGSKCRCGIPVRKRIQGNGKWKRQAVYPLAFDTYFIIHLVLLFISPYL